MKFIKSINLDHLMGVLFGLLIGHVVFMHWLV